MNGVFASARSLEAPAWMVPMSIRPMRITGPTSMSTCCCGNCSILSPRLDLPAPYFIERRHNCACWRRARSRNGQGIRSNPRLDSLSCRIDERRQFEPNPSHTAFAGEFNANARCPTSEESAIVEIHGHFRANRDEPNSGRFKRDRKRRASTSGLSNDRLGTFDDLQNGSRRAIPAAH
jgi:hypothetical protein